MRDVVDGCICTSCGVNAIIYFIVLVFDYYSLFPGVFINFYLEFTLSEGLFSETWCLGPSLKSFSFAFAGALRGLTAFRTVFRGYFSA